MKAVEQCKINTLIPIFKEGVEANAIEVARIQTFDGEDCEFNIIVGKGLYKIGDTVLYIMPDFCIPDNDIFGEYWAPNADPKKSRLGKNGRIRAVKFNFQFENSSDPIYSNGIILPWDVATSNGEIEEGTDLQELFHVTKYVASDSFDSQKSGINKEGLPYFLYQTDEPRCLYETTLIETEDGLKTIKEICDLKYSGKVKSMDIDTGVIEFKSIIDWSSQRNNHDWYNIELEDGSTIIATGNHSFYLPELGCYREVKDLKESDELFCVNNR